jgi:hypothetical protein
MNPMLVASLLGTVTIVHLVLGTMLLSAWYYKKLVPADRSIVMFWASLSLLTAIICGFSMVYIADLSGLSATLSAKLSMLSSEFSK